MPLKVDPKWEVVADKIIELMHKVVQPHPGFDFAAAAKNPSPEQIEILTAQALLFRRMTFNQIHHETKALKRGLKTGFSEQELLDKPAELTQKLAEAYLHTGLADGETSAKELAKQYGKNALLVIQEAFKGGPHK